MDSFTLIFSHKPRKVKLPQTHSVAFDTVSLPTLNRLLDYIKVNPKSGSHLVQLRAFFKIKFLFQTSSSDVSQLSLDMRVGSCMASENSSRANVQFCCPFQPIHSQNAVKARAESGDSTKTAKTVMLSFKTASRLRYSLTPHLLSLGHSQHNSHFTPLPCNTDNVFHSENKYTTLYLGGGCCVHLRQLC